MCALLEPCLLMYNIAQLAIEHKRFANPIILLTNQERFPRLRTRSRALRNFFSG